MQPGFLICRAYSHTDRRMLLDMLSDVVDTAEAATTMLGTLNRRDAFLVTLRAFHFLDAIPEEEARALLGANALATQDYRYAVVTWAKATPTKLRVETRPLFLLSQASREADVLQTQTKNRTVFVIRFHQDAPISPGMAKP